MNIDICKKCEKHWEFYFLTYNCAFSCQKNFDSFIQTLNFDTSILNELIYLNKVKENKKNIQVKRDGVIHFINNNINMTKKIERYFIKFMVSKKCPYWMEHQISDWNKKK
ncbi:MAG: hypothetical protein IKP65_05355 [Alphaproteobacteria bacterium]|nr:hypothetical protein [Alphaproteobacteria bacterium]